MATEWVGNVDELRQMLKRQVALTDYFEVTQERINQFAEATEDRQWIHVDLERAKNESPFGGPIAHGFLTLSLLSLLLTQVVKLQGFRMGVNYGLNYVRFLSPLPAGALIRARFFLVQLEDIPEGVEATWRVMVERQGALQPPCVAEWIVRYYL